MPRTEDEFGIMAQNLLRGLACAFGMAIAKAHFWVVQGERLGTSGFRA